MQRPAEIVTLTAVHTAPLAELKKEGNMQTTITETATKAALSVVSRERELNEKALRGELAIEARAAADAKAKTAEKPSSAPCGCAIAPVTLAHAESLTRSSRYPLVA